MAYSMEERVLTVKTFYQTRSFMRVQRYFLKKFNRRQAPAVSRLVQTFELTGSVCYNKKRVVGRHRSARTHDNVARCPRKSDTMFPVTRCQKNITTRHYATGFDVESLQNASGTDAHYRQHSAETFFRHFSQFMQQYPVNLN
jgi:hypothetical protein